MCVCNYTKHRSMQLKHLNRWFFPLDTKEWLYHREFHLHGITARIHALHIVPELFLEHLNTCILPRFLACNNVAGHLCNISHCSTREEVSCRVISLAAIRSPFLPARLCTLSLFIHHTIGVSVCNASQLNVPSGRFMLPALPFRPGWELCKIVKILLYDLQ